MTEQPRNWDKELADIDRVIERGAGQPPAQEGRAPALPPAPGTAPARVPAPPAPSPVPPARGAVAKTWLWVVLALLLAAALALWPYGTACGLQLFFYMGAAALALLAGVAGAVSSWAARRGLAHLLSLLAIVWAGVVGAREVLPRIGYAAEAAPWLCPATPEPAPPAPAGEAVPTPPTP